MTHLSRLWIAAVAALGLIGAPMGTHAQSGNPFAPAIIVNDTAITNFELSQRALILRLFRTPGNLLDVAEEQLVNERLQLFAARQQGVVPTDEEIAEGMAEFAGRANLSTEAFIEQLARAGVDAATFRDFVAAGIAWRQVVRGRFGPRAQVTEAEIDRALALTSRRGGAEALISEIILPARTPAEAARSEELALQIATTVSTTGGFASAARRHSVSPSRGRGGRVPQAVPLSNLPPPLAQQLLVLGPGEVSDPVPIPNAIALFQVRELRETGIPEPDQVSLEYAQYFIPGGRSPQALAEAARVINDVDQCDDLYGVNQGQAEERLVVETLPREQVPNDIALELAQLDAGETSTNLVRGANLMLLMLCARTEVIEDEIDRGAVRNRLINQRLAAYANGYLAELKADAIIRNP